MQVNNFYSENNFHSNGKKRSKYVTYSILFLSIATSFFVWLRYLPSLYIFFSILILLEVIFFSMINLEFKNISAKEIALMSSLATLAIVSRIIFFAIPQVKPTAAIVFITGLSLGSTPGFMVGLLSMFLSNFVFGQSLNTPFQMLGMGLVGFIAGLFAKYNIKNKFKLWLEALLSFLLVFLVYGFIVDLGSVIFVFQAQGELAIFTTFALGIPFNLAHALATLIFVCFLSPLLSDQLIYICNKYGLFLLKMLN